MSFRRADGSPFPPDEEIESFAAGKLALFGEAGLEESEVFARFSQAHEVTAAPGGQIGSERRAEGGVALRLFYCGETMFRAGSYGAADLVPGVLHLRGDPSRRNAAPVLPARAPRQAGHAAPDPPHSQQRLLETARETLPGGPYGSVRVTSVSMMDWIANSHGLRVATTYRLHTIDARYGRRAITAVSRGLGGLEPAWIRRRLVEESELMDAALDYRALPQCVMLAPEAGACLVSLLVESLRGDRVRPGESWVRQEELGRRIASDALNLLDDGTAGPFGRAVDGEGSAVARKHLLRSGVLSSLIADGLEGRASGRGSTGNCMRHSYLSPPRIGSACAYVQQGRESLRSLRLEATAEIRFIAPDVRFDPAIGVISGEAWGNRLVDGDRGEAQAFRFDGKLRDFLSSVVACGDDLDFYAGATWAGSPSLLLDLGSAA